MFVRKIRTYNNVDEIDTWFANSSLFLVDSRSRTRWSRLSSFVFRAWFSSVNCNQLHQHFTSNFFTNILSTKNYKAKLWLEKSWAKHFCPKKLLVICWQNWQHFKRSFYSCRSQKRKRQSSTQSFCDFGIYTHKILL